MTTEADPLTAAQRAALDTARALAAAGVPLFVAPPDPASSTGFALPVGWQQTVADPAVVDSWRPGMALCAVMGHTLDLIDVDPRNGGDAAAMNGSTPRSYGVAATPSGGMHSFIRALGTGSRDNVFPGIDIKGGTPEGTGRGFAFIAPTVRISKETGQPAEYQWVSGPDLAALAEPDASGERLAARIRELKGSAGTVAKPGGPDWWRRFLADREPQSQAAAERAITAKLNEVEEYDPAGGAGFRNVLMRAAMTLGGYVGGGYLDEDDARQRLYDVVSEVWGTPDADDELWIDQGLRDGQEHPFHVYTPADELAFGEAAQQATGRAQTGGDQEPPWTVYSAIGLHPFDPSGDGSDQGLAEAVVARMAPALRYGVDSGTWLVRDRHVWLEREDMAAWAVASVARLMPVGQTPVPKELTERTEAHWQAVRRAMFMSSAGSSKVERKLKAIARNADHPGGILVADLDADPEVLWAGGYPWDLRASGEEPVLAQIDPTTPHLRTALCLPERRPTPAWDAFVARVWPDPEVRAWAMRVLSIALAGYPDAALPVLYGPERTGKTALVTLLVNVLGSYGHAADPRLLAGADNAHASVVYALKGRRLSFIDEGPRRGHLAAERLKQLTGGGHLTGNAMRANPVTFAPTHTLVMTTNDEPPITDPALRARMRIIPCESDRAEVRAARQALTPAVWAQESPGVLASLMAECAAWLADQESATLTSAPDLLRGVVDDMAAGQDPVREWVSACCVPADPGTPSGELYNNFAEWHARNPVHRKSNLPSHTAFGRSLNEQKYYGKKLGRGNERLVYRPLSVLSGPSGVAPWEPMPSLHMVRGGHNTGTVTGTVGDGSESAPSPAENPSSTPVSSFIGESGDSTHTNTVTNNTHTPNRTNARETTGKIGGEVSTVPTTPEKTGVDLGKQGGDAPVPTPAPNLPPVLAEYPLNGDLPEGFSPLHNVTTWRVTAWATARGIDKETARAELKEIKKQAKLWEKAEERQAKIATAAGEVIGLPAVADRAGHVFALSLEQAAAVVRTALGRTEGGLTVDIENTGYPPGHALYALRTIQLGDDVAAVDFDASDPGQCALVAELLAEARYLHAHSATADLVPLVHAGLIELESAWERMYDTVIPAKLGDPASTGSDPALKKLAQVVLGHDAVSPAADAARAALFKAAGWLTDTKITTPIERSGWAQVDPRCETMIRYAASDVLDTAAAAKRMPPARPEIVARERLAQRMTARVTHHGVALDYEHVQAMRAKHEPLRAEAGARVRELGSGHIENPGSDTQIAKAILALGVELPRTDAGNPSVAKDVLEPMKIADGQLGELVRSVLEFRHHDTVLGTFLEPYRLLCEQGDGRARPTVYTLGTDTGRMSCVRPNLQQLSRQGGVRACITADPGQLMIGADFSGVELRVAAALSGDPFLRQLLAEGRDLHEEIALQVFGPDQAATEAKGRPAPLKEHRYVSKRIVFGRLYGGGVAALAGQAGVAHAVAQAAVDTLDALTPGLAAWSESVRSAVRHGHTQFPSYSGRIIHLPREFPHKAPNYCIQGSARELLVDAMVKWRDTRWGTAVMLPVHDEFDAFVPAEDADEATRVLVECMETELYGIKIIADPSTPAFAWADSS